MSLKSAWKQEIEKLKGMPRKKRAEYIFDYYKFWIIGGLCLLLFAGNIIGTIVRHRPTGFYAVLLNGGSFARDGEEQAEHAFAAYAGIDEKKQRVYLEAGLTYHAEEMTELSMAVSARISGLYSAGELDAMTADEKEFAGFAGNGMFEDLRSVLPKEQYAALEEEKRILWLPEPDGAGKMPVGIRITGAMRFKEDGLYPEGEVIFGITKGSERKETAVKYLDFLLGKEA